MGQRIDYIDLAKGICILLVAFQHGSSHFMDEDRHLLVAMSSFRMPLYFFLSGLFFKLYENYCGFLKRKVNKLLIPFLFWHILSCFLIPIMHKSAIDWSSFYEVFITSGYPNGPLWFLLCLFWSNQIFYAIHKAASYTNQPLLWIIVGSTVLGLAGFYMGGTSYEFRLMNIDTALTSLPFFCGGYICRKYTNMLHPNAKDRYLLPAAIVFALYTYFVTTGKTHYIVNRYDTNLWVTYSCGFSGIFFVLAVSKMLGRVPIVSYFGRYSIMILVTHILLIDRFVPVIYRLGLTQWWLSSLLLLGGISVLYLGLIPLMKRWLPYVTAQKDVIIIDRIDKGQVDER